MVLSDIIYNIGVIAENYGGTYITNDITKLNTLDDIVYPVIGVTQGVHSANDDSTDMTYNLNIFYIDRLIDNWEDNDIDIQSDGIVNLTSLIRDLENKLNIDVEDKRYTPFNQRFTDECAGVYLNCNIITPIIRECDNRWI